MSEDRLSGFFVLTREIKRFLGNNMGVFFTVDDLREIFYAARDDIEPNYNPMTFNEYMSRFLTDGEFSSVKLGKNRLAYGYHFAGKTKVYGRDVTEAKTQKINRTLPLFSEAVGCSTPKKSDKFAREFMKRMKARAERLRTTE